MIGAPELLFFFYCFSFLHLSFFLLFFLCFLFPTSLLEISRLTANNSAFQRFCLAEKLVRDFEDSGRILMADDRSNGGFCKALAPNGPPSPCRRINHPQIRALSNQMPCRQRDRKIPRKREMFGILPISDDFRGSREISTPD